MMRISKKVIIVFFIGLLLGSTISITVFNVSMKKNARIKVLEDKIELLQNMNRSLNIDSTITKK